METCIYIKEWKALEIKKIYANIKYSFLIKCFALKDNWLLKAKITMCTVNTRVTIKKEQQRDTANKIMEKK